MPLEFNFKHGFYIMKYFTKFEDDKTKTYFWVLLGAYLTKNDHKLVLQTSIFEFYGS